MNKLDDLIQRAPQGARSALGISFSTGPLNLAFFTAQARRRVTKTTPRIRHHFMGVVMSASIKAIKRWLKAKINL